MPRVFSPLLFWVRSFRRLGTIQLSEVIAPCSVPGFSINTKHFVQHECGPNATMRANTVATPKESIAQLI